MNDDDDNNNNKQNPKDSPSSAEKQQLGQETPQGADAATDTAPTQETDQRVTVTVTVTPPKKRRGSRKEDSGATSSGVQKPKRKVELLDPPTRDPDCVVCGKHFHSWKALFGHMRSHPDRQWRGVFPPPTGTWDPFGLLEGREEIASTLLSVAEGVLANMNAGAGAEGNEGTGDGASASLAGRGEGGLGIDLNEPQEKGSPSKSPRFDLNMPPAPEKDDEEDSASSS